MFIGLEGPKLLSLFLLERLFLPSKSSVNSNVGNVVEAFIVETLIDFCNVEFDQALRLVARWLPTR